MISIMISFIHDNIPLYYVKMQNTPKMDELKVNRDDNIYKVVHKKWHEISKRNDTTYHMTLV